MNPKDLLNGWWSVSLLDENDPSGGLLLKRSDPGHGIWHFVPSARPDRMACKGTLEEYYGGERPECTFFAWYPAGNLLVIDRSDLASDGYVWICHEEEYRVERMDENTLKIIPTDRAAE